MVSIALSEGDPTARLKHQKNPGALHPQDFSTYFKSSYGLRIALRRKNIRSCTIPCQ
jgi:hypothetical protein